MPTDAFTILVVEDEPDTREEYTRQLSHAFDIKPIGAATQDEAVRLVKSRHFDLAVVDIELDLPAGGYEVMRTIAADASSLPVVIVTRHFDPAHVDPLLGAVTEGVPAVVAVLDKGQGTQRRLKAIIDDRVERWRSSAVTVENAGLVTDLLEKPSRRRRIPGLRVAAETASETDRLFRALFAGTRSPATQNGDQGMGYVRLAPIEREGLSPAVTVDADIGLGADEAGEPVVGNRCVIKVGPREEIAEEAERYRRYVKFGIRLKHRVEMLGHVQGDALGLLCYSFAGGVFGSDVAALDELLRDDERVDLALATFKTLFNPDSREWYSVNAGLRPLTDHFGEVYQLSFPNCLDRLDRSLQNLAGRFQTEVRYIPPTESTDGSFEIGGVSLTIPERSTFGRGPFVAGVRCCPIHGDMHGGNVLVEIDEGSARDIRRVCLIDYRSVGPGPRCLDAAMLQSSVRLADAERISAVRIDARKVAESHVDARHEDNRNLTDDELREGLAEAARRTLIEEASLRHAWDLGGDHRSQSEGAAWKTASEYLLRRLRLNFPDLKSREYLATSLACAVRQLKSDLDPIQRVRTLAWASAVYRVMQTENDVT